MPPRPRTPFSNHRSQYIPSSTATKAKIAAYVKDVFEIVSARKPSLTDLYLQVGGRKDAMFSKTTCELRHTDPLSFSPFKSNFTRSALRSLLRPLSSPDMAESLTKWRELLEIVNASLKSATRVFTTRIRSPPPPPLAAPLRHFCCPAKSR